MAYAGRNGPLIYPFVRLNLLFSLCMRVYLTCISQAIRTKTHNRYICGLSLASEVNRAIQHIPAFKTWKSNKILLFKYYLEWFLSRTLNDKPTNRIHFIFSSSGAKFSCAHSIIRNRRTGPDERPSSNIRRVFNTYGSWEVRSLLHSFFLLFQSIVMISQIIFTLPVMKPRSWNGKKSNRRIEWLNKRWKKNTENRFVVFRAIYPLFLWIEVGLHVFSQAFFSSIQNA